MSLWVGRVCVSADQHSPSAGLRCADSPESDALWLRTVDHNPAAIWSSSLASAPDPCNSAHLLSVSIKGQRKGKRFVFIPYIGTQALNYCVFRHQWLELSIKIVWDERFNVKVWNCVTSTEYTVFPSVRGSLSSQVTEFSIH